MKHQLNVGIDIGSSTTRVVVCEQQESGLPRIIASSSVETKGVHHGYVLHKDQAVESLTQAVRAVEKELNTRIRSANLCIGGIGLASEYATGSSIVTRADALITKVDIEKAIQDAETTLDLKNKTILHAFPMLFKVDGKELPTRPEGTQGHKLEVKVLFITCFEQHLDDLLSVVNEVGIKVTNFVATPIAAQQFILTDLQKNFGCALIDIGAETVSVSVFENNTLASLYVFGLGSLDITKDIALGLRITPEEAESIKIGVVSFQNVSKKRLDEIIEARLSDIFELIDKYFKKIGRSGLLPAGAIIIGAGSQLASIDTVAKQMLKIPARTGHIDMPSTKGIVKDQRLINAYSVAAQMSEKTKPQKVSSDNDGFIETIKNFFKQLMP
jgi:cell division protein FtsA